MACANRIANQNWIELPSPEMRSHTLEICRLINEQIHHYVIEGSLSDIFQS